MNAVAALSLEPGKDRALASVIALERISKSFGSTRAVVDVSLAFLAGEVHAVLGENGAGKSTVGKIVSGLVQPDAGRLIIDGRIRTLPSIAAAKAAGFAMVYQELSIVPDLTVAENICLGSEVSRGPFSLLRKHAETDTCEALLSAFGIDLDLRQLAGRLSVANQQLVELLKALARDPRVLILDEPTAMLSVREKDKLLSAVKAARQRGVAVIFVTHHAEEVVEVADRVSLMKDGKLVDSFAMTPEIDAGVIVGKLVTDARIRKNRTHRTAMGESIFTVGGLPGAGGERVDISIKAGQIVGLYGVVGAGCEAVGRAAVGLSGLAEGSMTLAGRPHRPKSPAQAARMGVSYLPSGRAANGIFPVRSTRENLMIGQLGATQRLGVVNRREEDIMTTQLLTRFRTRYANSNDMITKLSGGNQQKVVLARCLGRDSRLVVLEDPTAGVDIGAKRDIHELIRDRAESGLAILLISSDLMETIALCDTIHTVLDGKIVQKYVAPSPSDEAAILADVLGH